jgi:hypothetical protein
MMTDTTKQDNTAEVKGEDSDQDHVSQDDTAAVQGEDSNQDHVSQETTPLSTTILGRYLRSHPYIITSGIESGTGAVLGGAFAAILINEQLGLERPALMLPLFTALTAAGIINIFDSLVVSPMLSRNPGYLASGVRAVNSALVTGGSVATLLGNVPIIGKVNGGDFFLLNFGLGTVSSAAQAITARTGAEQAKHVVHTGAMLLGAAAVATGMPGFFPESRATLHKVGLIMGIGTGAILLVNHGGHLARYFFKPVSPEKRNMNPRLCKALATAGITLVATGGAGVLDYVFRNLVHFKPNQHCDAGCSNPGPIIVGEEAFRYLEEAGLLVSNTTGPFDLKVSYKQPHGLPHPALSLFNQTGFSCAVVGHEGVCSFNNVTLPELDEILFQLQSGATVHPHGEIKGQYADPQRNATVVPVTCKADPDLPKVQSNVTTPTTTPTTTTPTTTPPHHCTIKPSGNVVGTANKSFKPFGGVGFKNVKVEVTATVQASPKVKFDNTLTCDTKPDPKDGRVTCTGNFAQAAAIEDVTAKMDPKTQIGSRYPLGMKVQGHDTECDLDPAVTVIRGYGEQKTPMKEAKFLAQMGRYAETLEGEAYQNAGQEYHDGLGLKYNGLGFDEAQQPALGDGGLNPLALRNADFVLSAGGHNSPFATNLALVIVMGTLGIGALRVGRDVVCELAGGVKSAAQSIFQYGGSFFGSSNSNKDVVNANEAQQYASPSASM